MGHDIAHGRILQTPVFLEPVVRILMIGMAFEHLRATSSPYMADDRTDGSSKCITGFAAKSDKRSVKIARDSFLGIHIG